jgi:hypothetical protein
MKTELVVLDKTKQLERMRKLFLNSIDVIIKQLLMKRRPNLNKRNSTVCSFLSIKT